MWLVGRFEFLTLVRRRSFVLATVGFPLLIAAVVGAGIVIAIRSADDRPLGYVDQAGIVTVTPEQAGLDSGVAFVAYLDRAAAERVLREGAIQGYAVIPAGYRQGEKATFVAMSKPPDAMLRGRFDDFLRANLIADQPLPVQQRLNGGVDLTIRSPDGRREFSQSGIVNVLLPFVAGFFFIYVVLSFSGYLLQAVTTEKENRTMEIMATSLSSMQLIGGKAGGLLAVALTQLAVWLGSLALALAIGGLFVPELARIQVSGSMVAVILLYFIPSFALMGGFMIAIGSAVTELQQGQQIASILNLFFMAPFFVLVILFANPDGPLAVALTLFPTTSFLTISIRWALTAVPPWQLALSWLALVTSALVTVWLAGRVFRLGMLSYGQRLGWASFKAALRHA
jgi:ABC-2 type transport system permease protein